MDQSLRSTWDRLVSHTIVDEDGAPRAVEVRPPATATQIEAMEQRWRVQFPEQLRALLLISNGCRLWGLPLLPLSQMTPMGHFIPFHSWDNGDFDAVCVADGRVSFLNHSELFAVGVAASLAEWLEAVFAEKRARGVLFHPSDYPAHGGEGMYGHVRPALAGTDCELNR